MKVNEFLTGADVYLIAHAYCVSHADSIVNNQAIVVTEEHPATTDEKGNKTEIKIPDVCRGREINVRCIDTATMLRELKVKFILEGD